MIGGIRPAPISRDEAEAIAIAALSYLAGDPEALGRFFALTGIDPSGLRAAAHETGFLAGVLDYFASDESLLMAFAEARRLPPQRITQAHAVLARPSS